MMRLHYAPGSAHSAAVRIVLAEKGVEPELHKLDIVHFEQHSPEYLAVNCHGTVPLLEDNGRKLFESFAILEYLDETYPDPPLIGDDPRKSYIARKWGKYVETHIAPHLAIVRWAALGGRVAAIAQAGLDRLLPERAALWRRALEGFGSDQLEASARAMLAAHPYEEPAYDVVELADPGMAATGTGRIGNLPQVSLGEFAAQVAAALPATAHGVRVAGDETRPVRRVAVCGGAGDFLLDRVAGLGVDAYVTSDLRHHPASEFLEKGGPALLDVSHWAAEWTWLPELAERLGSALGDTVEVRVSTTCTDVWQARR